MRRLVVALAVAVVLLVVLLGVALLNASRLATRFRPDIERMASASVGASVTIGGIDASVFPSVHIGLERLAVGGDAGPSLERAVLHLRLLPLLRGRLEIRKLGLEGARATLLRDAEGVGVVGLPRHPAAGGAVAPAAPSPSGAPRGAPVMAVDLQAFEMRDSTIQLRDVTRQTELTIDGVKVDAALAVDASGVRLPRLRVEGRIAGQTPFVVQGKDIAFDPATGRARVPGLELDLAGNPLTVDAQLEARAGPGQARVTSTGIDLAKLAPVLAQVAPETAPLALRGTVTPDVDLRFSPDARYAASGKIALVDLAAETGAGPLRKLAGEIALAGTLERTEVRAPDVGLELGGRPMKASAVVALAGQSARLEESTLAAFGGTARASGTYDLESRAFAADLGAEGLDLGQMQAALKPGAPPRLLGTLTRFQSHVTGTLGSDVARSLGGSGSLLMKDGRLPGVDIAGQVLGALGKLPLVGDVVSGTVMPQLRGLAGGKDTVIDSASADFALGGAAVQLARLAAVSRGFSLDGRGRVRFDGNLDLEATMLLDPGLSRQLVKPVQLTSVLDGQGRLAIPFTMNGTPPNVRVVPDVRRLAGGEAARALEKKAGKAVKGLLDDLMRKP